MNRGIFAQCNNTISPSRPFGHLSSINSNTITSIYLYPGSIFLAISATIYLVHTMVQFNCWLHLCTKCIEPGKNQRIQQPDFELVCSVRCRDPLKPLCVFLIIKDRECLLYKQMIDSSAFRRANRHVVWGQPCRHARVPLQGAAPGFSSNKHVILTSLTEGVC